MLSHSRCVELGELNSIYLLFFEIEKGGWDPHLIGEFDLEVLSITSWSVYDIVPMESLIRFVSAR